MRIQTIVITVSLVFLSSHALAKEENDWDTLTAVYSESIAIGKETKEKMKQYSADYKRLQAEVLAAEKKVNDYQDRFTNIQHRAMGIIDQRVIQLEEKRKKLTELQGKKEQLKNSSLENTSGDIMAQNYKLETEMAQVKTDIEKLRKETPEEKEAYQKYKTTEAQIRQFEEEARKANTRYSMLGSEISKLVEKGGELAGFKTNQDMSKLPANIPDDQRHEYQAASARMQIVKNKAKEIGMEQKLIMSSIDNLEMQMMLTEMDKKILESELLREIDESNVGTYVKNMIRALGEKTCDMMGKCAQKKMQDVEKILNEVTGNVKNECK